MAGTLLGLSRIVDPLVAVVAAAVLLPTLLLGYPICRYSRRCLLRFVQWKYPYCRVVEESSTRSILDQGKNQGIYTLLVEWPSLSTDRLRAHLGRLASAKPLLRHALTTKCCLYAWERLDEFSVDDHLLVSPASFKGRPISEANVQDYVSDVTSKYLAGALSPWQVHLIGQQSRYVLVRAHHLLLRQEQLAPGDFLPLERSSWPAAAAARDAADSPFANLYAEPSALPRLHQQLTESFSNVWNEFLCNNDPTERPEILKKRTSLWQCAKIWIIVCFCFVKELRRQRARNEAPGLGDLWPAFAREARKRSLSWSLLVQASINLLNPAEMLRTGAAWLWYLAVVATLKTPILLWREIRAASLLNEHHYYPDSLVSILSCYLPLIFRASLEALSILAIAAGAPLAIMEELLRGRGSDELRAVSQSGRKVVAWSEEIEVGLLQRIAAVSGAADAEILLAAAVDSLKEYFRCAARPLPAELLATAKFRSQRSLYAAGREPGAGGLLCLALPTRAPLLDDDPVEMLQAVQSRVREARRRQRAIYAVTAAEASSGLLTRCLPSVLLKLALNHLSRRYSLAITHVDGQLPVDGLRSAVFWRPPQGNCSLSMTLHRHAEVVRLGVMADAMLGPQHAAIARSFPRSLDKLAKTLGVPGCPSGADAAQPAR
ncbi:uncharacterized protein LOC131672524 isoform X2 [Phymastichus coffea]|uniref:uncharacterized protein LOC131672524 isoform X2 n=1 Tax=Phymastichus coffea TaxID=108790 RepID=UPI00273BAC9F|nr:uncharacterized protein LOC131672524 isoform X2 [Phymastichus coffea]